MGSVMVFPSITMMITCRVAVQIWCWMRCFREFRILSCRSWLSCYLTYWRRCFWQGIDSCPSLLFSIQAVLRPVYFHGESKEVYGGG